MTANNFTMLEDYSVLCTCSFGPIVSQLIHELHFSHLTRFLIYVVLQLNHTLQISLYVNSFELFC